MSVKQLTDFLAVRGISSSGRKVELVAKTFAAVELGFNIIESTEQQQTNLDKNYKKKLTELNLPNPKQISKEHLVDDITKWPLITLGVIFSYILKRK